ncbi:MAG: hypothetical protein AAF907_09345, partial [Planctomycetota bacterium]
MPTAPRPSADSISAAQTSVATVGSGRSVVRWVRILMTLSVACIVLGAGVAVAQQAQPPARPQPQAMRVPQLDPALEATLQAWYLRTKDIKKLEGSLVKIESDNAFRSETHSVGRFYYQAPDKGRIDSGPRPK